MKNKEVIETVMTYDQWKVERKRRMKRKFAKKWNRVIESVRETLHSFSLREKVLSVIAVTSVITMATVVFPYAAKADLGAECIRVENGNYYDYMCVVDSNGEEWLLDDSLSSENRYMHEVDGIYMPVFEQGECVQITFDTKGTQDIYDDEIVNIEGLEWF